MRRLPPRGRALAVTLLVSALTLAGCGGDDRPSVAEIRSSLAAQFGTDFDGAELDCIAEALHASPDISDATLTSIVDGDPQGASQEESDEAAWLNAACLQGP